MASWKPEVIHICTPTDILCGARKRVWPEEHMSDEVSRALPICEDCKSVYKERFGRDFRQSVPVSKPKEQVGGLFLVDFKQF